MDYLQYYSNSFKLDLGYKLVLNLIINGLPSIFRDVIGFLIRRGVLNLIINGLPSI